MKAAVGDVVKLTIAVLNGDPMALGDIITTPTGRAYVVVAARQQTRGKGAGRWHLRAQVIPIDSVPRDMPVFRMTWDKRGKA